MKSNIRIKPSRLFKHNISTKPKNRRITKKNMENLIQRNPKIVLKLQKLVNKKYMLPTKQKSQKKKFEFEIKFPLDSNIKEDIVNEGSTKLSDGSHKRISYSKSKHNLQKVSSCVGKNNQTPDVKPFTLFYYTPYDNRKNIILSNEKCRIFENHQDKIVVEWKDITTNLNYNNEKSSPSSSKTKDQSTNKKYYSEMTFIHPYTNEKVPFCLFKDLEFGTGELMDIKENNADEDIETDDDLVINTTHHVRNELLEGFELVMRDDEFTFVQNLSLIQNPDLLKNRE
jgi:hypothetical protein